MTSDGSRTMAFQILEEISRSRCRKQLWGAVFDWLYKNFGSTVKKVRQIMLENTGKYY